MIKSFFENVKKIKMGFDLSILFLIAAYFIQDSIAKRHYDPYFIFMVS